MSGGSQLLLFVVLAMLSKRHQLARQTNWDEDDIQEETDEGQGLLADYGDDQETENEEAWFISRD